jgi:23S rRNA (adenine2503-C2)-methyltransferase
MNIKDSLLSLYRKELCELARSEGLPAYRGNQIADWIFCSAVKSFDEMNNLSQETRQHLKHKYPVGRSRVVRIQKSKDGTIKLLLELGDGQKIETVGIPYRDRYSCCVSTQVGCSIGCLFCATGVSGFKRNLTAGEIVDQVLSIVDIAKDERHKSQAADHIIDNIVFMGMGEPLLNYDATLKAIRLINEELGIGARRITISTVGIVPGIEQLMNENMQFTLAVSLHAPTEELRRHLLPGARKWPLYTLMDCCRDYIRKTERRVTFEYCLLEGINDSEEHAYKLAEVLSQVKNHINIIPYNSVAGLPFKSPSRKRVESFVNILKQSGLNVTQRMRKGADINAACGQLRRTVEDKQKIDILK